VDRIFDRLARLHKAGKTRPHRWHKTRAAPKEAAVAVDCQHDHHGIGARKMLGLAPLAVASPAAADKPCRSPAVGAKAVARMPVQDSLGFGDRRQVIRRDQSLYGDRSQVGHQQIAAALQSLGRLRRKPMAKSRRAIMQAEKNCFRGRPEFLSFGRRE
jgi:hypothetical protein